MSKGIRYNERNVFSFKNRIAVANAAHALALTTADIKDNYLAKVWGGLALEKPELVRVEVRYLVMYHLDGLIKHTTGRGWAENRKSLAMAYYVKCYEARAEGEDQAQDDFWMDLFSRLQFYNSELSKRFVEVAEISDADTRFVRAATIVGAAFAKLCEHAGDGQFTLIGAGALTAVQLSTEKLFQSALTQ